MKKFLLALSLLTLSHSGEAYEAMVQKGQLSPNLEAMLAKASRETGVNFRKADFQLIEERTLATSHFTMYVQTNSQVPVAKTAVRIWADKTNGELILAELHLDESAAANKTLLAEKFRRARFSAGALKSTLLSNLVTLLVSVEVAGHPTDSRVLSMSVKDQWENGDLVREATVRGRRGVHVISVSLLKNKVLRRSYREFPQSERVALEAHVYPIYEEVEGTGERLPFELRELRYIDAEVREAGDAPLGNLGETKFSETNYSPLLAETALGEMNNLWSEVSLRKKVEAETAKLPLRSNTFENGVLLQGKYATVNLHPAVKENFSEVAFPLVPTINHLLNWSNESGVFEAKPIPGLAGKMITSSEELLTRVPFRHPEHDPTDYINSGFDEVQVYYAVTVLMETLVKFGFTDQELSEKPFHAFLYDPDIGMRDNAYYYDNTINFTTYSPSAINYARDNSTIWHELGHAIMERLMGSHLGFADSKSGYGGLSEGMADFLAQIIVEHETRGETFPGKKNFRIMNETGFYLTNEYHDDGEAYGGALNDMFLTAIAGETDGLHAFTDLTLEAMRLTRNHPSLSAAAWFEHLLYADSLGSAVRRPDRFRAAILEALKKRNFSFSKTFTPATMNVSVDGKELTNDSPGSREKPIDLCQAILPATFDLRVGLTSGDADFIRFPATVKVEYQKGALQGAIHWGGEARNPESFVVNSAAELADIPIRALGCDSVNQPDGSCKDYAYVQVFNQNSVKPIAKKRFYLKLNPTPCE